MANNIDWEQRRYEIAKDIFARMCVSELGYHFSSSYPQTAIKAANELIEELKKQNKHKNYDTDD